jgi:DNA-binding LytR/AlgR family response regulator
MFIKLFSNGKRFVAEVNKISFIKADGNYSMIHLLDGCTILTSKTLRIWQDQLEEHGFLRCHHGLLINKNQICSISKEGMLLLKDGKLLQCSRRMLRLNKSTLKAIKPLSRINRNSHQHVIDNTTF